MNTKHETPASGMLQYLIQSYIHKMITRTFIQKINKKIKKISVKSKKNPNPNLIQYSISVQYA